MFGVEQQSPTFLVHQGWIFTVNNCSLLLCGQFLTGHRLVLVCGLGVGTPGIEDKSMGSEVCLWDSNMGTTQSSCDLNEVT